MILATVSFLPKIKICGVLPIAEYEQATLCSDVCNAEAGSVVSFFSVLLFPGVLLNAESEQV